MHGYPLDRTIWRDQIDSLEGYRRIAPDLRGMGQSDAPDLGYGMGIYADDLAALLDALGVNEVVLCGLSMGGYVIFEFLRRWRHRVRALILMDTRAEADSTRGPARAGRGRRDRPRSVAPLPSAGLCSRRCWLPAARSARPSSSTGSDG